MMAVVVIGGAVIGCKQSGTRSQLKAAVLAFAALAAVIVAFCAIVIVASQRWAAPACAAASIIVPLAVYFVTMAVLKNQRGREASAVQGARRSVTGTAGENRHTSQLPQRQMQAASTMPIASAEANGAIQLESEESIDRFDLPYADQDTRTQQAEKCARDTEPAADSPSGLDVAEEMGREPEFSFDGDFDYEPAPESSTDSGPGARSGEDAGVIVDLESAIEFEAAEPLAVDSESAIDFGPGFELETETETETEPEPELDAELEPAIEFEPAFAFESERASEPEPEPEPVSAPEPLAPTVFDPSSYFAKATTLRDKGLFAVAAKLYAECAELAEDRATFRKASIEEIACYVKAAKLGEAQRLAAELKASSSDLSAAEAMKIDAVLRMAAQ